MKYFIPDNTYGLCIWSEGNTFARTTSCWTSWLQTSFTLLTRCSALTPSLGYVMSVLATRINSGAGPWAYATFLSENHTQVSIWGNLLGRLHAEIRVITDRTDGTNRGAPGRAGRHRSHRGHPQAAGPGPGERHGRGAAAASAGSVTVTTRPGHANRLPALLLPPDHTLSA